MVDEANCAVTADPRMGGDENQNVKENKMVIGQEGSKPSMAGTAAVDVVEKTKHTAAATLDVDECRKKRDKVEEKENGRTSGVNHDEEVNCAARAAAVTARETLSFDLKSKPAELAEWIPKSSDSKKEAEEKTEAFTARLSTGFFTTPRLSVKDKSRITDSLFSQGTAANVLWQAKSNLDSVFDADHGTLYRAVRDFLFPQDPRPTVFKYRSRVGEKLKEVVDAADIVSILTGRSASLRCFLDVCGGGGLWSELISTEVAERMDSKTEKKFAGAVRGFGLCVSRPADYGGVGGARAADWLAQLKRSKTWRSLFPPDNLPNITTPEGLAKAVEVLKAAVAEEVVKLKEEMVEKEEKEEKEKGIGLTDDDEACVDLLTADQGLKIGKDKVTGEHLENYQELFGGRSALGEFCLMMRVLKRGGHFVVKLFDNFTLLTGSLIYAACQLFEEVRLVKPFRSRPVNSERYLVCLRLCDRTSSRFVQLRELMETLQSEWSRLPNTEAEAVSPEAVVPLAAMKEDDVFMESLTEATTDLCRRQAVALQLVNERLKYYSDHPSEAQKLLSSPKEALDNGRPMRGGVAAGRGGRKEPVWQRSQFGSQGGGSLQQETHLSQIKRGGPQRRRGGGLHSPGMSQVTASQRLERYSQRPTPSSNYNKPASPHYDHGYNTGPNMNTSYFPHRGRLPPNRGASSPQHHVPAASSTEMSSNILAMLGGRPNAAHSPSPTMECTGDALIARLAAGPPSDEDAASTLKRLLHVPESQAARPITMSQLLGTSSSRPNVPIAPRLRVDSRTPAASSANSGVRQPPPPPPDPAVAAAVCGTGLGGNAGTSKLPQELQRLLHSNAAAASRGPPLGGVLVKLHGNEGALVKMQPHQQAEGRAEGRKLLARINNSSEPAEHTTPHVANDPLRALLFPSEPRPPSRPFDFSPSAPAFMPQIRTSVPAPQNQVLGRREFVPPRHRVPRPRPDFTSRRPPLLEYNVHPL